ncbi:PREDICTED: pEARLI1-like lipid transfer protein 3 [Nelumbo nucifera]|uniref:Pectinesterase inhibitor domain-containing protein n=2 Tax=Nelumbo nucifera TaxID=4432 RepID=A0A822YQL3_NELNU|nr:PREDICTED: pEARLI1-like lipid transfer protein 3 [Nelumbo nucifera]DAD33116.1 TPA_asm: hypothetical protein HUJ06_011967 [Nelumbo nucifera]
MEYSHNYLVLTIFLSSLLLFYSAEAACVPRNNLEHFCHDSNLTPPPPPPSQSATSPSPSQPTPSSPPHSQPAKSPSPSRSQPTPSPPSPPSKPTTSPSPSHSTPSPPSPPSQPTASPPAQQPAPTPSPSETTLTIALTPSGSPSSASFDASTIPKTIDPAIIKMCNAVDYPELCLSSITPYLTEKTDPVSVLEMLIKACNHDAEAALNRSIEIIHDPKSSSQLSTYMDVCRESYADAVDNLQTAMNAIPDRDIGTINSMLSAASTDFGTCDDAFAEIPQVTAPMAEVDDKLIKQASNCLAITSMV